MRKIASMKGWSMAAAILFASMVNLPLTSAELHPLKSLMKEGGGTSKSMEINTDASTGTVTTLAPGKEKEPVTCNEIMAQAVVIASEEKETAIQERDEALSQAARSIERAEELAALIDGALEEAKNATIEYEAVKLMSERLVEEAKRDGEARVQAIQEKSDAEKNDLTDLFLEQQQALHDDVEKAKKEMHDEAQEKIEEAMLKLKNAEEKAQQQIKEVNSEMESLKERAAAELKAFQEQSAGEIKTITEKSTAEVQTIKAQSAADIAKVQSEMETLMEVNAAEKEKLKKEADELVARIKEEAQEELDLVRTELMRMITDAEERAARSARDAEQKVESVMKQADTLVHDTQRNAKLEYQRIQQEASEAMAKQEKIFMDRFEALETEFFEYRRTATKKVEELEADNELKMESITKYKQIILEEKQKFEEKSEEMQYWKTIHDEQGYVNTTLVMIDSRAFVDKTINSIEENVINVLREEVTTRSKDLYSNALTISKPHQDKMKELYHEHLETIVEESIMPFYFKHIIPMTIEIEKKMVPILEKIGKESELQYSKAEAIVKTLFNSLCTAVKDKIVVIKKASIETGKVPDFVISFLETVENDTATTVMLTFRLSAAFLTYTLRYLILSALVWIIMLPLRVIWYFCPLRFIIGGGDRKREMKKKVASEMASDAKKRPKIEDN